MIYRAGNKHRRRIAASLLIMGAACCLSACSGQTGEPVIAERSSAGREELSGEKSINGQAESGKDAPGDGRMLAQQTEAPKRYRAEVIGDYVELRADAPVFVPEAESAPVRRVETGPAYSETDLTRFQESLREAEGVTWGENQFHQEKNGGYVSGASLDDRYYVSFRDGNGEGETPLLWLTHKKLSHGTSADFDAADVSGMSLSSGEKRALEEKLRRKAERLLGMLDLDDFKLTRSQWKALSKHDGFKWQPDGRYGLLLSYSRTLDGIAAPFNRSSLMGEVPARSQYVDFVYADDGELVELKDVGRERYSEEEKEEGFLLPFSAVAQIFEQYCKTFCETVYQENPDSYAVLLDESQRNLLRGDMSVCAYVTVTDVALEYRPEYETKPDGNAALTGTLEPVWNFYGEAVIGYRNPDHSDSGITRARLTSEPNTLLVSIRAGDGHVYGK